MGRKGITATFSVEGSAGRIDGKGFLGFHKRSSTLSLTTTSGGTIQLKPNPPPANLRMSTYAHQLAAFCAHVSAVETSDAYATGFANMGPYY